MSNMSRQEEMYCDIVQLIVDVVRDEVGVDLAHNPLFSGRFKQGLERNHNRMVRFITKYVPDEPIEVPEIRLRPDNSRPVVTTVRATEKAAQPSCEGNQVG